MATQPLTLVWFRQDLRLADNPALAAAAERGGILPVYILDDAGAGDWALGEASRVWLHHSLASLDASLDGRLRLFRGDAAEIVAALVETLPVDAVYWNRCYEPWRMRRDSEIKSRLRDRGIEAHSFNASLLWEPWDIAKADGTPYRVFTPFYQKGCFAASAPRRPQYAPESMRLSDGDVEPIIEIESSASH